MEAMEGIDEEASVLWRWVVAAVTEGCGCSWAWSGHSGGGGRRRCRVEASWVTISGCWSSSVGIKGLAEARISEGEEVTAD